MEAQLVVERDCSALGGLFQIIINDMKSGNGNWDDFVVKANKFHTQLKATIAASTAFLDAFQKIADMATSTRGGTKEIGTALTRLCLRHRSVEARLKTFTSSIMDCLILPLQDRIEEWKKTCGQLDKEHSKEYKRLRQELKKKQGLDATQALYASTSNTLRFKKHVRNKLKVESNNWNSLQSMSRSMDSMEANEKLFMFEGMEKKAVRRALIEERSHYCVFVNLMRPVVEEELAMIQEVTHLQEILDALCVMTADPYSLPSSSELVISDLRLSTSETAAFSLQTPPSSPSSFGSRKSSMCSISSFNSSSSGSTHSPSHHCRYRSLSQPSVGPGPVFRHTSISSQDSGFMSQDYNFLHYAHLPIQTSAKYVNHFKNNEVSSLSEQSSGSTSSTSSIPASNKRMDPTVRSQSIKTYDKNRSHDSYSLNHMNASEENLISVLNNHNIELKIQNNENNVIERPELPSRIVTAAKPSLPAKPNTFSYDSNRCQTGLDSSLYCESHPIYANSSELMNDESNVACSEGSITPTNPERSNSPCSEMFSQQKNSSLSASTLAIPRSSKPAPPPPVRRTSTLSNPNAITLSTLKSAGVNTYEEIQNLSKAYATYEDINSLTLSLQNLSSTEAPNQQIYSRSSDVVIYSNTTQMRVNSTSDPNKNSEYKSAKSVFESPPTRELQLQQQQQYSQPVRLPEEESTALPLPAPPPEAFSDSESGQGHHYNKITNVHRQFLETLNSKLGQFKPESHISPRLAKRRSVSLTHHRDDEWNSDSGIGANRTNPSQSPSIQQTLMAFMTGGHHHSSRSSSTSSNSSSRHRRQSPETSRKKAAFTLGSCDRQSLMASLNVRLAQRQQNEIAKAAVAQAIHRKDMKDPPNHMQSQQSYSSSALNLANVSQSANQYQAIGQPIVHSAQQVSQQSQVQQQIYGPALHQQQLQRRSSQPTMGIKIINNTCARQQNQSIYETNSDKQSLRGMTNKSNSGQSAPPLPQSLPQQSSQPYSTDFYANARHTLSAMPSESNSKLIYSSTQNESSKTTARIPVSEEKNVLRVDISNAAARVNSWFNSVHLAPDVKLCRESLMDQIKRGKQLRKVSAPNDRSAPKIA